MGGTLNLSTKRQYTIKLHNMRLLLKWTQNLKIGLNQNMNHVHSTGLTLSVVILGQKMIIKYWNIMSYQRIQEVEARHNGVIKHKSIWPLSYTVLVGKICLNHQTSVIQCQKTPKIVFVVFFIPHKLFEMVLHWHTFYKMHICVIRLKEIKIH